MQVVDVTWWMACYFQWELWFGPEGGLQQEGRSAESGRGSPYCHEWVSLTLHHHGFSPPLALNIPFLNLVLALNFFCANRQNKGGKSVINKEWRSHICHPHEVVVPHKLLFLCEQHTPSKRDLCLFRFVNPQPDRLTNMFQKLFEQMSGSNEMCSVGSPAADICVI